MYTIKINDRSYTSWTISPEVQINPSEQRLFSGDTFTLSGASICDIIQSPIRSSANIPGVLILKDNKTYGRSNQGKGKLLYRCIPDDVTIPTFLVAYEMKSVGFSKVFPNIYITFQFKEWTDKHPQGIVNQVMGPVDEVDHFCEYQLYCKQLNISLQKFNKDTSKKLQNYSSARFLEKYPTLEDRTAWKTFTIDPENSRDFDDGFSIRALSNGITMVSVYIANVVLWMEILDLWESFSRRVATIYLPGDSNKKPMLPVVLSDSMCSLGEKTDRPAFAMDVFIREADNEIVDIQYAHCMIHVYKNYVYEAAKLRANPNYVLLKEATVALSKKHAYIPRVGDSHEVVCYWMTLMNHKCAQELLKHRTGIFRTFSIKPGGEEKTIDPSIMPAEISSFIHIWNSHSSGEYAVYKEDCEEGLGHDIMGLDVYTHITSPIRRMVDLLNMIQMELNRGSIGLSEKARRFHGAWLQDVAYINVAMKNIRRVQNDCSLLYSCKKDPAIMERVYTGYLFNKTAKETKLQSSGVANTVRKFTDEYCECMVYLPDLKITSRVMVEKDVDTTKPTSFQLYVFHDEERMKKKIRIQILPTSSSETKINHET